MDSGGVGGGLAFKPPQRPGARKSQGSSAIKNNLNSNNNNNTTTTTSSSSSSTNPSSIGPPSSPTIHKQRSKSSLGFTPSINNSNNANLLTASSNTSPSSSDSDDSFSGGEGEGEDQNSSNNDIYAYNGAPSSSAAQTVAASKQCSQKLQSLLADNQERVHAAGRLGQELLNQKRKIEDLREELEEVLSQQEELDRNNSGDDTLEDSKLRIQDLREKIDSDVELMESQTSKLLLELGANSTPSQSIPMSPSKQHNAFSFLSKDPVGMGMGTPSRQQNPNVSIGANTSSSSSSGGLFGSGSIPGQPTPRQSDRRARNNLARQSEGDQEFREEVHKGLLNEVRRISALLVERDAEIALLREKNEETEKDLGIWKPKAMAAMNSEDSLKSELWEIQLVIQERDDLIQKTTESLRKAESERNKFNRDLIKSREANDAQRVENDELTAEIEKLRNQRDTDGALARKEQATMKRDNSDLQAQLKSVRDKLLNDRSNISRSASHSGVIFESSEQEGTDDDDPRFGGDLGNRRKLGVNDPASPSADASTFSDEVSHSGGNASPLGNRLVGNKEVQDLRTKLSMAHKKAGKDLADKKRQREKNEELRKLLAKAGVDAPAESEDSSDDDDDDEETNWNDEPRTSASAKSLAKMRGRIPKSSTRPSFASRLGLGRRKGSTEEVEEDEFDGEEPEESDSNASPSGLAAEDHSIGSSQGMDPAFSSISPPSSSRKVGKGRRSAVRNQGDPGRGSPLARGSVTADEDEYDSEEKVSLDEVSSLDRDHTRSKRPASSIIEAGALGDELSGLAGPDDSATRAAFAGQADSLEQESSSQSQGTQKDLDGPEMAEMAIGTEPRSSVDLVGPALLERDQLHAAALSAKDDSHAKALSAKDLDHAASLQAKDQSHAKILSDQENRHIDTMTEKEKSHVAELMRRDSAHADLLSETQKSHNDILSQKDLNHASAISSLKENHSKVISSLEDEHEKALSSKDAIAAAALSAALLERNKVHEAGLAEARSRHTKALADQVDSGKAELSRLEAQHKNLLAEKERSHKSELDKKDTSHAANLAQALSEKEEEHESYIKDIEATNKDYVSRVEAVFKQGISERDALIKSSGEEIERLRSELDELKSRLEASKHDLSSSRSAHAFKTQELASTKAELATAVAAVVAAKEREREREREEVRKQEEAAEADEFEDAKSDLHAQTSPAVGLGIDPTGSSSSHPLTRDLSTSGSETDSPKTPQDEKVPEIGIKKVVLADLKDTSCQTDDDIWYSYQQQQQRRTYESSQADPETAATRPPSALTDVQTERDLIPTQGNGIVILGGHRGSVQRPRDSISTFGGNRDGSSIRAESPAPTMYTVGAMLPGQRRRSADSNFSHIGIDKSSPTAEVIPDKTKPPVMALPPPPSMPPPPGLPVKRSPPPLSMTSMPPPARPTSPPPASMVTRAARGSGGHLQVPGDRPSSRLSGASAPPSAYNGPSNSTLRATGTGTGSGSVASGRRQRTISTDTTSGMTGSEAASLGRRKSLSSAKSGKGKQRVASSAASFASDVTSIASERMSVSSSRASDMIAEDGNRRMRGPNSESMDPDVMSAIMNSMIGSFLWKYTRKSMGRSGHSDNRHRRYFWLHPYTNMVYWQVTDPGGAGVNSGISKNAVFDEVKVVEDNNHNPPGLYHLSIVLKTKDRDMKLTAPNRENHEAWVTALDYLVSRRPAQAKAVAAATMGQNPSEGGEEADATFTQAANSRRERSKSGTSKFRMLSPARSFSNLNPKSSEASSNQNFNNNNKSDLTPRARGSSVSAGSVLSMSRSKRRDTAAHEYLSMQESQNNGSSTVPQSPRRSSIRSNSSSMLAPPSTTATRPRASELFGFASGLDNDDSWGDATPSRSSKPPTWNTDPRLKSAEQMLEEDEKDGYEGLDNVRACCDGKHDVGSLAHKHHHNHSSKSAKPLHKRMSSGGSSLKLKNQLVSVANKEFGLSSSSQSVRARPSDSPAPQLSLNLSGNDSLPPRAASALGNYENSSQSSNFQNGSSTKSRPESGFGSVFAAYENHANNNNSNGNGNQTSDSNISFSERIGQIRRSRQSTGGSK